MISRWLAPLPAVLGTRRQKMMQSWHAAKRTGTCQNAHLLVDVHSNTNYRWVGGKGARDVADVLGNQGVGCR